MQSEPLTDRHTVATSGATSTKRGLGVSSPPWKLADTSDRKEAELAPLTPLGPGFYAVVSDFSSTPDETGA